MNHEYARDVADALKNALIGQSAAWKFQTNPLPSSMRRNGQLQLTLVRIAGQDGEMAINQTNKHQHDGRGGKPRIRFTTVGK